MLELSHAIYLYLGSDDHAAGWVDITYPTDEAINGAVALLLSLKKKCSSSPTTHDLCDTFNVLSFLEDLPEEMAFERKLQIAGDVVGFLNFLGKSGYLSDEIVEPLISDLAANGFILDGAE